MLSDAIDREFDLKDEIAIMKDRLNTGIRRVGEIDKEIRELRKKEEPRLEQSQGPLL
jgi:hypothetical protein